MIGEWRDEEKIKKEKVEIAKMDEIVKNDETELQINNDKWKAWLEKFEKNGGVVASQVKESIKINTKDKTTDSKKEIAISADKAKELVDIIMEDKVDDVSIKPVTESEVNEFNSVNASCSMRLSRDDPQKKVGKQNLDDDCVKGSKKRIQVKQGDRSLVKEDSDSDSVSSEDDKDRPSKKREERKTDDLRKKDKYKEDVV
jgi:hypothetical protein